MIGLWLLGGTPSVAEEAPHPTALAPLVAASGERSAAWEPIRFARIAKRTQYTVDHDAKGTPVLRAESRGAASGLMHRLSVDLEASPTLRWRWKVERYDGEGDPRTREGDDHAARVYVAFDVDRSRLGLWERVRLATARAFGQRLPARSLNYVWDSGRGPAEWIDSPYAGSFVRLRAVSGEAEEQDEWQWVVRDVRRDYIEAFGEEPPRVAAVAIMTDTDDTRGFGIAYYGDLSFHSTAANQLAR